jgi:glycosyltransferase involved in cell wall biosynthesis
MRILQLCTKVPYPPKDGGAAGIFVFTKAFSALGHIVDVLAVNPPKHFINKSEFTHLPKAIKIYPVEFDTSPHCYKALRNLLLTTMPYQVERFIHCNFTDHLIEILAISKPDIVQLEGIYLCPYIPLIRKHSHARIILRAHNIEHNLWYNIANNESNFLKRTYLKIQSSRLKKYEIEQLTKVNGVTTVTEYDFSILKTYQPKIDAKVIPFGVELENQSLTKDINLEALFFIGALDWMPNQEAIQWFIGSVWPRIYQQFKSLRFHIAGRNSPSWLSSYLQNQQGVVFYGEISDAQLFFNKFSIMVVPLFSGGGIRVKIIEAMQQGKVVIASSKAAEGIPVVSGQHLLLADTIDEFVNQISLLLSNVNLIKQISYNAKELIREKFNILAITSDLIDFFNNVENG